MTVKEKGGVWIATGCSQSTPSHRVRGFSTYSAAEAKGRCSTCSQGFTFARFKHEDVVSTKSNPPKPKSQPVVTEFGAKLIEIAHSSNLQ